MNKFNKNTLPGSYIVSKAIDLNALPPVAPTQKPQFEPVVKAEPAVDMDSEDDIPLEATYELEQEDLDQLLDEAEQEPTVQGVSKALKDIHAKLDAFDKEDEEGVVEMEDDDGDEDDKEPVEKAARGAVKYLRRFRKGNRWVYIYKNAKGHVNAKHLPGEGHKFQAGEAIHTGDSLHRVKSADERFVTTVDEHGVEHDHTHDELREKAHEGHKDAIEAHKKHGYEQRKAVLKSAKDHGHAPTIARAQKELDRFSDEHGIVEDHPKKKEVDQMEAALKESGADVGDLVRDYERLKEDVEYAEQSKNKAAYDKAIDALHAAISPLAEDHKIFVKNHQNRVKNIRTKMEEAEKLSKKNQGKALDALDDLLASHRRYEFPEAFENGKETDEWSSLGGDIRDLIKKIEDEPEPEPEDPHGLYSTLGVASSASQDEIKAAYKDKAKEHHPDKGGDAETIKKINAAYDVLKDPDLRDKYHETGDLKAVQSHAKSRAKKSLDNDTVLESLDWLIHQGA